MSLRSLLRRLWCRYLGSLRIGALCRGSWPDLFTPRLVPRPSFRPRGSLRAAIVAANSNASKSNTINLGTGTFDLTDTAAGELLIQDTNAKVPSKTLTIIGQVNNTQPVSTVEGGSGWSDRIFEIASASGAKMTVVFKKLYIENGHAANGGMQGGNDRLGGGILIDGGTVSLTDVGMQSNVANGSAGGGPGGPGGKGKGGGIYRPPRTVDPPRSTVHRLPTTVYRQPSTDARPLPTPNS